MGGAVVTHYLQTATGTTYDLERPDPTEISLVWVAASLSKLGRYTGHTSAFYSVAQHCVLGARMLCGQGCTEGTQRYFLLHDAHETVTGDVASPIKRVIGPDWFAFEEAHRLNFAIRFGIGREVPALIKGCDLRMLMTEVRDLLPPLTKGMRTDGWPNVEPYPPSELRIRAWDHDTARREYLAEASRLGVL
jgi:hypothetical protein